MNSRLALKIVIALVGYIAWATMAYFDATLRTEFAHFNIMVVTGVIGLALRDLPTAPNSPQDKQSGHASPAMLAVAAALVLLLTGCAGFQQAVAGYQTAVVRGAQAMNDNTIQVWSTAACATPLSAVLRNPQVIPALKVLCLPAASTSDAAALLDHIPANGAVSK